MPRRSAAALNILPETRVIRLRPPASLPDPERTAFIDLVTACRADHFHPCDLPLLCRYAELIVLCDQAAAAIRAEGAVSDGKASPWLAIQRDAIRGLLGLSMRLRVSPQARQGHRKAERPPPISAYEKMRLYDVDSAQ
jgi:phage terminase small subunit